MEPNITPGQPLSDSSIRLQDLSFHWTDRRSVISDRTEPVPDPVKQEYYLYIREFKSILNDEEDLKVVYDSMKSIVLRTEEESLPRIRLLSAAIVALSHVIWDRAITDGVQRFKDEVEKGILKGFYEKYDLVYERGEELVRSRSLPQAEKVKILGSVTQDLVEYSDKVTKQLHLSAALEMNRFNSRATAAMDELLAIEPELSEPWRAVHEQYIDTLGRRLHDQGFINEVHAYQLDLAKKIEAYRKLKP